MEQRPKLDQLLVLAGTYPPEQITIAIQAGLTVGAPGVLEAPAGTTPVEITIITKWSVVPGEWELGLEVEARDADGYGPGFTFKGSQRFTFPPEQRVALAAVPLNLPVTAPGSLAIDALCDGEPVHRWYWSVAVAPDTSPGP